MPWHGGLQVKAVQATFDDYVPDRPCDLILFYECLHHAVRPWEVVDRLASSLAADGAIVLAGEPVNEIWWPHWGIRLDPMSIYCIRKFGWFESGWSIGFISKVFARSGMSVEASYDASLGYALVARKLAGVQSAAGRAALARIAPWCSPTGWFAEADHLVLRGKGLLTIPFPKGAKHVVLKIRNYRASPVALKALS